ncbi:A/G-specific adenine glycosylase [Acidovorax sp. sif1233]|uniref:A/G-specific adenine glycosylase n=1 Tax=Acidovorax sp. sif1233 TaxID=2854792 RepID=UPI001C477AB2|nr:A/G-specific adenine glycosylase [Acidovorax sp. sif1233]MBV7453365.1 A/G-specific adenine glycosylase [Acidovorax sp. sif1233]
MSATEHGSVAERVVAWQSTHGRNHLPWQQTRDPYRVWLSEIMLQQTQVATVLDYYARFLARFPDVRALAQAGQDEVMGLWSGLGYYARARNLHRCAQQVVAEHGGVFPDTAAVLATLPGIGRSTAGAIAAFCFSERVPILDANVRRVLTRLLGFDKDLASAGNERLLWEEAQALLPRKNLHAAMPRYTQGLMDLGASVCTPKMPRCGQCPLASGCAASRAGDAERYPVKTRRLVRRSESWQLLVLRNPGGRVWLQRRPAAGIWAGMHCVPVFADGASLMGCVASLGDASRISCNELQPFLHVLTHRDLHLHPVLVAGDIAERPTEDGGWFGADEWHSIGLPAPIRKLLDSTQAQLW